MHVGPSLDLERISISSLNQRSSQRTLDESSKHFAPRLQKRMAHDNLQEPLESFSPVLNHVVGKAVREHLARQRGYRDASGLALEDVAKGLKLAIPAAHRR